MTNQDRPELAIERIRHILEDDVNYQSNLLKLGGIWHACMDAADYEARLDVDGFGVVEVKAHD